jgi:hypothetical protein
MPGIYQGSTPKYLIRIRDIQGNQLDPSDVGQILEVRVWIYNSISGDDVVKFYLNTAPSPLGSWRQAAIKEVTGTDKRILLPITAAETLAALENKNEIQVEITIPDNDFDDDKRIIIRKGIFPEIKSTKL